VTISYEKNKKLATLSFSMEHRPLLTLPSGGVVNTCKTRLLAYRNGECVVLDAAADYKVVWSRRVAIIGFDHVLSSCGKFVVKRDWSGALHNGVYFIDDNTPPPPIFLNWEGSRQEVALSPDGHIARASSDRVAHAHWLAISTTTRAPRRRNTASVQISKLQFSSNGKWLLCLWGDIWCVVDTTSLKETPLDGASRDAAVFFARDGDQEYVVVLTPQYAGHLPDVHKTVFRLRKSLSTDSAWLDLLYTAPPAAPAAAVMTMPLVCNPLTRHVLCFTKPVRLLDVVTGTETSWWGESAIAGACISDDGRLLATACHDAITVRACEPRSSPLFCIPLGLPTGCRCRSSLVWPMLFHTDRLVVSTTCKGVYIGKVPRLHDQLARLLSLMLDQRRELPSVRTVYFILTGIQC
jgi:hypothetical protein